MKGNSFNVATSRIAAHEFLHLVFPNASESQIIKKTNNLKSIWGSGIDRDPATHDKQ